MSLDRLLNPRSIAVFGGVAADELIRQCDLMGFQGDIWPVHPNKVEIHGRKVYRTVRDLPGSPDAAYVAVNRNATIDIVRELAAHNAGGAVCYATGFVEAGAEGAALQAQLLDASGDMPLIGPNCYGLMNYLDGAMLWPDQQGGRRVDKGVAIITMSSNVGFNLTMQRRGLPIAYLVSLGNRLKFDICDAIRVFAADERVTAIGLYLESVGDPVLFEAAAASARETGTPMVVFKSGRSEAARKIAVSHTTSLAGADELVDALFKRSGVARVNSLEALLEALKVLHVLGPLNGNRVGAMSTSGGDLSLLADAMHSSGLVMPELTGEDKGRVRQTVHERIVVANPLDYQMFDWNDEERLCETFSAFLQGAFDVSLCLLDYPRADRCDPSDWGGAERAFVRAATRTGSNAAIMASFSDTLPESLALQLIDEGIVPLVGVDAGLAGLQAAVDVGAFDLQAAHKPLLAATGPVDPSATSVLDEAKSKAMLASYGIQVPVHKVVGSAREAVTAARRLGFPVAVKALGIVHKTESSGVMLGLADEKEVKQAAEAMLRLGEHCLVEQMVDGVIAELIIGVARDEQFGPYLLVGSGGVLVELLKDTKSLLLPLDRGQVMQALNELKCAPLLQGYRGQASCDLEAVVDAVLAVAALVEDYPSGIAELDINPLMVRAEAQGAIAADALISMYVDDRDYDEIAGSNEHV